MFTSVTMSAASTFPSWFRSASANLSLSPPITTLTSTSVSASSTSPSPLRSILLTPDSCLLTPLQTDACLAWIKLRHPIVVPQHAVAQVRQHHRHRDLREKLMLCSLEYRLAVLILNGDRLPFCINLCADVLALHFVVFHIQPVRQVAFCCGFIRRILDAHGIPCHLTDLQLSLSEGCLCHHHHTDAQQDS